MPEIDVYTHEKHNISNRNIECQWLTIVNKHFKNILIGNIYRPPDGKLDIAIKAVNTSLKALRKQREEILILGDFKVDYKNKSTPNYKKVLFFEKSNTLTQMIKTTTRHTKSSATLIDIAFSNSMHIAKAGTIETNISDHQPIYLIRKKERNSASNGGTTTFEGRTYRRYEKQAFMDGLVNRDWTPFYETASVDEAWNILNTVLTEEADILCPIRTYNIRVNRPPWMTHELIEMTLDRDYFYKKAKRTQSSDDWNIAKFLRNQTNRAIRQAKADFVVEQLTVNEGNSSKFWRTINAVMPGSKDKTKNAKIVLTDQTGLKIDDKQVASHINHFFTEVGKPVNCEPIDNSLGTSSAKIKKGPSTGTVPDTDTGENNTDNTDFRNLIQTFVLGKLGLLEVRKLIAAVNVSKSSGLTNMSSRLVKDGLLALLPQITHLFNFSLNNAIFPTVWKHALVIPIPKTGDLTKVNNYRPISLLPLPGKILEKLVHTQLTNHLEENGFISDSQFGFRRQRSTTHAITHFLNQVYSNINKSAITAAIFIDFRKAFDCVQHSTLLGKLKELYLDQQTQTWLTSYLSGRSQRTLANNVYSQSESVKQGVPQGSVLGPLLYIIYANDIAQCVNKSGYTFYADDTVLYTKKKSLTNAARDLQADLNGLMLWCKQNQIYINTSKTKLMFFGSNQALANATLPSFHVDQIEIDRATHYTYLGIKLDEQLDFEAHVNTIIAKVSSKILNLRKIRFFITRKAAVLIYKNMILPLLEYGDVLLDSAKSETRKKLQVLQNKALRCALNMDRDTPSNTLHKEASLNKLKLRRKEHLLLHMYQISHTGSFKDWKVQSTGAVRTRLSKKKLITIKKPNNEKYKKSISYRGPEAWNKLKGELQKVENYHKFKRQLRLEQSN